MSTRVIVVGAAGRMGIEVLRAVSKSPNHTLVGACDRHQVGASVQELCGEPSNLTITDKLGQLLDSVEADVTVDFTHLSASADNALTTLKRKVSPIIGTSGLSAEDVSAIRQATADYQAPAAIIPNFAIGAILMMKFAEIAAPYLPDCEIIELHHEKKLDAPSGTAAHTAELIANARTQPTSEIRGAVEKTAGVRGGKVKDVRVHSIRLPGYVASQEIHFGAPGERLSLRHDSIDRASFMQGVLLAASQIRSQSGLIIGLDKLMFS